MEKLPASLVLRINNMHWYPAEDEDSWQSTGISPAENLKLLKQLINKWGYFINNENLCFIKDNKLYLHSRLLESLADSGVTFAKEIIYPVTKGSTSSPDR